MSGKLRLAADRRNEGRLHLEAETDIEILEAPQGKLSEVERVRGVTTNVSRQGMRIAVLSDVELPQGSRLKLKLKPGRRSHVLSGTVRWTWLESSSSSFAMGIDLAESSPRAVKRWLKFLVKQFGEERLDAKGSTR